MEPLFVQQQAADLLAVSPRTLELWRREGRGPRWVRLGRAVRYRPEDLAEFLSERTCATTGDAT